MRVYRYLISDFKLDMIIKTEVENEKALQFDPHV